MKHLILLCYSARILVGAVLLEVALLAKLAISMSASKSGAELLISIFCRMRNKAS